MCDYVIIITINSFIRLERNKTTCSTSAQIYDLRYKFNKLWFIAMYALQCMIHNI